MLSGEGITAMTQGHENVVAPQPVAGNAASPCCHGNRVAWSTHSPSTSHLLQLEPRIMSLNFQLVA